MAKLGSFFRRLFSPSADMTSPTSSLPVESQPKLLVFPSSSMSTKGTISNALEVKTSSSSSRSVSPRSTTTHTVVKQTTVNNDGSESRPSPNFLSSHTNKTNDRRLSAPMIIHTSAPFHYQQQQQQQQQQELHQAIVDETTEEALISSLQRFSSSSASAATMTIQSNNSLGPSRSGSISIALQRPDVRSVSFHLSPSPSNSLILPNSLSNNLLNNNSSVAGTPPSQIVFAAQSSSPRVSIPSNNSPSYQSGMKDVSPASETTLNNNTDRKMSLPARGRRPSMFDPIDPKELQQALYASAAAKASLPTKPAEEEDNHRAISRIKICYDRESEHIFIDSLSFENLHNLDGFLNSSTNSTSSNVSSINSITNPDVVPFYCRFRLLPSKRSLFQTKIVRHPRSQPTYFFDMKQLNEFELTYDQLNSHSIEILVYKVGTTKPSFKDFRLASVKFDLADLTNADQISTKKILEECDPSSTIQDPDLGDLLVSLSYLQSAAKLAVVVLEAKNLRPLSLETKVFPEACVKVTLIDRNGKKIKRKKTSVQKASDCPTFNEELVFELKRDIAQEVMIELRIVHESLSYKEQLGAIVFGPMINNMTKGFVNPENVYWTTILSGESLNAQWQILKSPVRIDETK